MPFAFAFSFAFFIASSTISAPTSVLQFSDADTPSHVPTVLFETGDPNISVRLDCLDNEATDGEALIIRAQIAWLSAEMLQDIQARLEMCIRDSLQHVAHPFNSCTVLFIASVIHNDDLKIPLVSTFQYRMNAIR